MSRVEVSPSVIYRDVSGEVVLLNLQSGVYYGLDPVGSRMWQLLMEQRPLDDVNRFHAHLLAARSGHLLSAGHHYGRTAARTPAPFAPPGQRPGRNHSPVFSVCSVPPW